MQKIYIALDSDVLRAFSYVHYVTKIDGFFDYRRLKEPWSKFSGYIERILKKHAEHKIEFVILDTVWQENKKIDYVIDFIKEQNCYLADYTGNNRLKKKRKARELANLYCKPFTTPDGFEHFAPMQEKYDPNIDNFAPTADCYIMAEATIEGLCLLTNNGKDFVFNAFTQQKNQKQDEQENIKFANDRSFGITFINQQNGYTFTDENMSAEDKMSYSVPHPFLLYNFGTMSKNVETIKVPHVENPDFVTFEQSLLDN